MDDIPFTEKEETVKKCVKLFSELALQEDELLSDNLLNIYFILQSVYYNFIENLQDYKLSRKIEPKTSLTIQEKLDLIDAFYEDYGFPYTVDEAISDGSLDINVGDYNNEPTQYSDDTLGTTRVRGEHCFCDCEDHQTLYDTTVWIHELAHYRNLNENEPVTNLLTESMSFTMSLLYSDYLDSLGFEEAKDFLIIQYIDIFSVIDEYMAFILLATLYNEVGVLDEDGLELVFGNGENYKTYIEYAFETLCNRDIEEYLANALYAIRYALAQMISIYNFEKVQEDPDFIDNLIEYNDRLFEPTSLKEALEAIQLPIINSVAFFEKTNEYLEKHTERLKSIIESMKKGPKGANF